MFALSLLGNLCVSLTVGVLLPAAYPDTPNVGGTHSTSDSNSAPVYGPELQGFHYPYAVRPWA
jgi:hypothetical protein